MSFRLALRPSPLGFLLGLLVVAFWAMLWIAFLAQLLQAPSEAAARQPGKLPALARALDPGGRSA